MPSTVPSFKLMCVTSISFGKRISIDRKTVILRGDRDLACAQIFHRLIAAAMSKFQFEGRAANANPRT